MKGSPGIQGDRGELGEPGPPGKLTYTNESELIQEPGFSTYKGQKGMRGAPGEAGPRGAKGERGNKGQKVSYLFFKVSLQCLLLKFVANFYYSNTVFLPLHSKYRIFTTQSFTNIT